MRRPESGGGPSRIVLVVLQGIVIIGALLSRTPRAQRRRAAPGGPDPEDVATGYEHGDIRPRFVLLGAGLLLAVMGLVLVSITWLQVQATDTPVTVGRPSELIDGLDGAAAPTPAAPRLEAQPGQEFSAYRTAEAQKLTTYRWVDRQAGVVAIPIDRAMDLLAEQGLPTRAGGTPTARDSGNRTPSRMSSGRADQTYP